MNRLRSCLLALCLALTAGCATADTNVRVGIHFSTYPELVPVPGYPVYYAPYVDANFFFYDGDYWLYESDRWYRSGWYDGPWVFVHPDYVPLFVLRVPVRYYRAPPPYFHGWHYDAPPRWGHYWGPTWSRRHAGWDRWDRQRMPPPAPLPAYQRDYGGDRYPGRREQRDLRERHYDYRPHDVRQPPRNPPHYDRPQQRGDRPPQREVQPPVRDRPQQDLRPGMGGRPDRDDRRPQPGWQNDRPQRPAGWDRPQQRERPQPGQVDRGRDRGPGDGRSGGREIHPHGRGDGGRPPGRDR